MVQWIKLMWINVQMVQFQVLHTTYCFRHLQSESGLYHVS